MDSVGSDGRTWIVLAGTGERGLCWQGVEDMKSVVRELKYLADVNRAWNIWTVL
jgi:hypothetical protein